MYFAVDKKIFKLTKKPMELNYGELFLLAYIDSFRNGKVCYMTNKALANILGTSERTVVRWLTNLKQKELIKIYYEEIDCRERRVLASNLALTP